MFVFECQLQCRMIPFESLTNFKIPNKENLCLIQTSIMLREGITKN